MTTEATPQSPPRRGSIFRFAPGGSPFARQGTKASTALAHQSTMAQSSVPSGATKSAVEIANAQEAAAGNSPTFREILKRVDFRQALAQAKEGTSAVQLERRWYGGTRKEVIPNIKLDMEHLRLCWISARSKKIKALPLAEVSQIVPGVEAHWISGGSSATRRLKKFGFEIHLADGPTLRFSVNSHNEWKMWLRALLYATAKAEVKRKRIGGVFEDKVLVRLFRSVDLDGSGSLQLREALAFLSRLGVNYDPKYVSNLFFSLSEDDSYVLELDEFVKFMVTLLTEEHLVNLFSKCQRSSAGTPVLTEHELNGFFNTYQSDKVPPIEAFKSMRPPFVFSSAIADEVKDDKRPALPRVNTKRFLRRNRRRLSSLLNIFQTTRKGHNGSYRMSSIASPKDDTWENQADVFRSEGGGVTVYGFCSFLMSSANSILNFDKWDNVYQDMSMPICNYWIKTALLPLDSNQGELNSSMLTTLNGNQLQSSAILQTKLDCLRNRLTEGRFRAFILILRTVCLPPNGVIQVYHECADGYLVPWTDILTAIGETAFQNNPYPVILLLDTSKVTTPILSNTEVPGQAAVEAIWDSVTEILGSSTVRTNLSRQTPISHLHGKFIIQQLPSMDKTSKVLRRKASTVSTAESETNLSETILKEQALVDDLYVTSCFGDLTGLTPTQKVTTEYDESQGDPFTVRRIRTATTTVTTQVPSNSVQSVSESCSGPPAPRRAPSHKRQAVPLNLPCPTMKLVESMGTDNNPSSWLVWPPHLIREAATDVKKRSEIISATRSTPCLVLPNMMNFAMAASLESPSLPMTLGFTFNPSIQWLDEPGCGYVGLGSLIDAARFRVNGNIGYVAKPKTLIDGLPLSIDQQPAIDIVLSVLAVRQVPRCWPEQVNESSRLSHLNVSVTVGIDGVIDNRYTVQEQTTELVTGDGVCLTFAGNKMQWLNVHPNVSTLTFTVNCRDGHTAATTRTAFAAIPINVSRPGFRWVPLWDRSLNEVPWSGILIKLICRPSRSTMAIQQTQATNKMHSRRFSFRHAGP